jgi:uncharacterized membrane protein
MHDASPDQQPQALSKHRVEALVDGIFAVAMTLLVIDLRLPEHAHLSGEAALQQALVGLLPNLVSWLISFFVLAIFWVAHHRLFSVVRHVDQTLLWLTIVVLAGASLLPFASAVNSQYLSLTGQAIYSGVMILIAVALLLMARHIHRHRALCAHPLSVGAYRATLVRSSGVIFIAVLAIALATVKPGVANLVFLLMMGLRALGARVERRYGA